MRYDPIHALAGLAMLSVMSGNMTPRRTYKMRYSEFCGPPHPTTRQQLRALQRRAAKLA
jgi:heme/copper-type cytochrome/quinol oxidase subunit 2